MAAIERSHYELEPSTPPLLIRGLPELIMRVEVLQVPCHAKSKHVNLNSKSIGIDSFHVAFKFATCGVEKFALVVKMLRLKVLRGHSPDTRPRILNQGMVIKNK